MKHDIAPVGELNKHDFKVLAFHFIIIFIQGGLIALGKENFGTWTPMVAMWINFMFEYLRRLIV